MNRDDLPHVTAVLADAGLIDPTWFTVAARDAGSAIHAATEFLDTGGLDWASVDPVIASRVVQYQRFKDEVRPTMLTVEERVFNDLYRYQGRLDRRVVINDREGILDIKGPYRAPWQAIQLSMYAACFSRRMARWTLHLEDSAYRLIEHRGLDDWNVAKAALTIAAWRKKNNE
jgi:hypothetical protein